MPAPPPPFPPPPLLLPRCTDGRGNLPFEPEREELREEAVEEEKVLSGKDIVLPGAERSLSMAEL